MATSNVPDALSAQAVSILAGHAALDGDLCVPDEPRGVVLFAHGSGSSRKSPRNRFVASVLQAGHFATLLMDLLTAKEEQLDDIDASLRFDIELLAERLQAATQWLKAHDAIGRLPIGYFGASTGAGAALVAAAAETTSVAAIVSRGGRPDLAGKALRSVKAATLLIVGGNDEVVIEMNQSALSHLTCPKQLTIIPGATHLFQEPGKLEAVADLALDWFNRYLTSPA